MGVEVTSASTKAILKTLWPQRRVDNLVYEDHTFLAMIPKSEDFYGENMVLAIRYADTQGRSADFAVAQANKGQFAATKFTLTRARDYQLITLTTEAILAAKSDKGSLIRTLDTEMKSGLNNIAKSLAVSLFRGKSGAIGQVGGAPVGNVVTLLNINDVTSFEVGMKVYASSTKTGAGTDSAAVTINGVDRDTGEITLSAVTGFDANDYIFAQGDKDAKVLGLDDWLPATAPAPAENFLGVDRSVDRTRLAGLRINASGLNPEEALVTAMSRLGREGGKPGHFIVNHVDFRNIEMALGSKVEYETMTVGEIGFTGLRVRGPKGVVRVLADQDCPAGVGYALQMDTWKLHSLEKCPQVLDLDGDRLSRETTSDGWEARIAYFANTGCTAPGYNARVLLPA